MPVPSLSLSQRMAALGGLGLLSAVVVSGAGLSAVRQYSAMQDEMATHAQVQLLLRELDTRASELKVDAYKALTRPDPAEQTAEFAEDSQKVTERLAALDRLPLEAPERELVRGVEAAFAQYVTDLGVFVRAAIGDQAGARVRWEEIQTANDATDEAVGGATEAMDAEVTALDEERRAAATRLTVTILLALALGAVCVLALTLVFSRSLARRVRRLDGVLTAAAAGDLTARSGDTTPDELGRMGSAVDALLVRFAAAFTGIAATGRRLGSAAEEVENVSGAVATSAGTASDMAGTVAQSASGVSGDVQVAAAGTEEMGASISEIARNAQEAARVAVDAVEAVQEATATMSTLGDSSREIGEVIRLITSIAEQTNLLALNATIEAARAGSAGKGFAVVADEVKQLAQETARATEDISRRVQAIQGDAERATQEIGTISVVIDRINEYQTTIAGAVEEQTATTQDMNASLVNAAAGSTRIADGVAELATATAGAASAMGETRQSAQELRRMSEDLLRAVEGFRY